MITGKLITKDFLELIKNQYTNLIVFLVDDGSGTLSQTSTMADAVNLELPSGNGYERQNILTTSFSFNNGSYSIQTDSQTWNFTGNVSFTHLCFSVGANTTIGDTTGTLERIAAVDNGNSLSFGDGESYNLPGFNISIIGKL